MAPFKEEEEAQLLQLTKSNQEGCSMPLKHLYSREGEKKAPTKAHHPNPAVIQLKKKSPFRLHLFLIA